MIKPPLYEDVVWLCAESRRVHREKRVLKRKSFLLLFSFLFLRNHSSSSGRIYFRARFQVSSSSIYLPGAY